MIAREAFYPKLCFSILAEWHTRVLRINKNIPCRAMWSCQHKVQMKVPCKISWRPALLPTMG